MSNDLLIKINADAKNATKAFDNIKDQTSDLEGQLKDVALISGAAFAAFTAEIFFSVKAFEEAQQAAVQLTNALQNQGIYTEQLTNEYRAFADVVQAKTGIDNDAIVKAQAIAQTFLGQTKITEKLTFAIADLGASMGGDLNGAAEKIARTIGTGTNAFARQGLVVSETATEAERYAKVLEFVQAKAGGLAEEFNKADGYTKALSTSFGNFQEEIGARFAPVVAAARQAAVAFFDYLAGSPVLVDFIAAFITAGAAVTGFIAAAAVLVPAFTALSAAAAAFGISMNLAFVGIPIAIGVVIGAVTLLALNWDKAMATILSATKFAFTLISELFGGLADVLSGGISIDPTKIEKGLARIKGAFNQASQDAAESFIAITDAQQVEGQKQNADKKALADKAAADERQHQQNLRAIRAAELELLKLQNENASAAQIDLKTKEIEVLKALDQQKSEDELALLRQKRDIILQLAEQQQAEDIERQVAFAQLQTETAAQLENQRIAVEADLSNVRLAQLRATAQTEADIDRKLQDDILTKRIQARNQELLERKKFGEAYAIINKFIQSDEVKGAKDASSELVQLSQSKNEHLKAIGKAASIAQITMGTAESAMNIFKGFSTIPIIGPGLGIAGAAAAVAFGAERISQVTAAADGGLITGGIPGQDSVPSLLTPGELVVPERNFDQVVGAVRGDQGGGQDPAILATLQRIEEKISGQNTTIIQGDVMAEDSYIDALVRRISDAIEFRNGQIFGVTA